MTANEMVEFILDGIEPVKKDGVNYYELEWQEVYEIANNLVKKLNLNQKS